MCLKLKEKHHNISLKRNSVGKGTYYNRNIGLEEANGRFFTVLDADDIAHPNRLEIQLSSIIGQSNLIGCVGSWIRITPRGFIHFKHGWGGCYVHEAIATFLFKTDILRNKVGYWDETMFSADTEYYARACTVFGQESILKINNPLCIASQISSSLTNDPEHGIGKYSGISETRRIYKDNWSKWHKESKINDLFLRREPDKRPFDAPIEMIPSFKYK